MKPILAEVPPAREPLRVESPKAFKTYADAAAYAFAETARIQALGYNVVASGPWRDLRQPYRPKGRAAQLLGMTLRSAKKCEQLVKGGLFIMQAEVLIQDVVQFQLYYSRYLPYALAMARAEDDFEAFGVDYRSIVALYRTCMGFHTLTQEEDGIIEVQDAVLYDECYALACELRPPQLPFDEVYFPACLYLWRRNRKLFEKLKKPGDASWEFVEKVKQHLESRGKTLPL